METAEADKNSAWHGVHFDLVANCAITKGKKNRMRFVPKQTIDGWATTMHD